MYKNIGLLLLIFQLHATSHFALCSTETDEVRAKLEQSLHDYDLNADNFITALMHVADEFRIPMGIEWLNAPEARAKVVLSWKKATVQEILETIVQTQPGYEVQVRNGVVHISSTKISPNQNFLRLRIGAFEVHHEVVEMAERRLRERVRAIVASPTKAGARGGVAGSLITNIGDPIIDVELNNATVDEILDALATASAKKVWIVTFVDSFILTATGFRRTLTLWNNSPVPDNEQPVWDMFSWDEPVPTVGLALK